eukprot:TRINITY_DN6665_c0_g1_i2.p1 TRINITY_DN6665_c0_g1~~TRINITY_DN6665_c0_g1_i2.p1  ORF type:complete len:450 (+),score=87.70 TRINITY_DN6665_c0_g1_i2:40-1389(+)
MEESKTIHDWLKSEALWWKWSGCLFWSLVFQLGMLFCLNGSSLSPGYWHIDLIIFGVLGGILYDTYDAFWSPLKGMRLVRSLLIHLFGGGALLWAYSALFGHQDFFLVFSGGYFGCSTWYSLHMSSSSSPHIFEFSWIQIPKKSQFRSGLPSLIRSSVINVIYHLRLCLLLYVTLCHRHETDWTSYLQSLAYLSLSAALLNTLFLTNLSAMRLILNLYLTEPQVFSLELLLSALNPKQEEEGSPLLRHLAAQDFALSMAQSPYRRAVFFTLSQPGGHPYNWNNILAQAEASIGHFTTALLKITNPKKEYETEIKPSPPDVAPGLLSSPFSNIRMRRLVSPPPPPSQPSKPNMPKITPPPANNASRSLSKMFMDKVSSLTAVPDSVRVRQVFTMHSESLMWVVEGLSHLIAHSVAEDRFGVVQKDLANVLSSLFNLQQVISIIYSLNQLI